MIKSKSHLNKEITYRLFEILSTYILICQPAVDQSVLHNAWIMIYNGTDRLLERSPSSFSSPKLVE